MIFWLNLTPNSYGWDSDPLPLQYRFKYFANRLSYEIRKQINKQLRRKYFDTRLETLRLWRKFESLRSPPPSGPAECDGLEQTIHETHVPSNCLTARIYGTPKLVLFTIRKSSDQSLIICRTTCSSDLCCSIVFNIPFKSSILFRNACWLLKIFLTGMRFCSSPLEPSPSLSSLSDEGVGIFFPDVIEKYTRTDCKILRTWTRPCRTHMISNILVTKINYSVQTSLTYSTWRKQTHGHIHYQPLTRQQNKQMHSTNGLKNCKIDLIGVLVLTREAKGKFSPT